MISESSSASCVLGRTVSARQRLMYPLALQLDSEMETEQNCAEHVSGLGKCQVF